MGPPTPGPPGVTPPGVKPPMGPGVASAPLGPGVAPMVVSGVPAMLGVAPGVGRPLGVVAEARGFGVDAVCWRGVIPEKSDGCRKGSSPPWSGVGAAWSKNK